MSWRAAWTIVSLVAVQIVICALSAAPVVAGGRWLLSVGGSDPLLLGVLISAALVPSYVAFGLCLMTVSPLAMRLLRWRTPADLEMPIADMQWPLMQWVRYGASIHIVRVIAGPLFRGTPLWTVHLRLGGARLGKRVYVNSLSISDYNLIECGDDVIIGADVHLSGHTVEDGVVKTARVKLGSHVTIGVGSVIEIGVEIGSHSQVGALSFVPKHTKLAAHGVYTGAPAAQLHRHENCCSNPMSAAVRAGSRQIDPVWPAARGYPTSPAELSARRR